MLRFFIVALAGMMIHLAGVSGALAQSANTGPINLKQFRKAAPAKKAVKKVEKPAAETADAADDDSGNSPKQTTAGRGFADDANVRITTLPVRVVSPDELNEIDLAIDPPHADPSYVVASNELNELDRAADDVKPDYGEPSTSGQAVQAAKSSEPPSHLAWLAPLLLSVGFAFATAIGAAAFVRRKPKPRARA